MEPTAKDWDDGYAAARARNERTLRPLNERGHWRPVRTYADQSAPFRARTIRFVGFEGDCRAYAPGDLYVWDESSGARDGTRQ